MERSSKPLQLARKFIERLLRGIHSIRYTVAHIKNKKIQTHEEKEIEGYKTFQTNKDVATDVAGSVPFVGQSWLGLPAETGQSEPGVLPRQALPEFL